MDRIDYQFVCSAWKYNVSTARGSYWQKMFDAGAIDSTQKPQRAIFFDLIFTISS